MGILRIRWGDLSLVGIGWAMMWFGLGGSYEVDHGVTCQGVTWVSQLRH